MSPTERDDAAGASAAWTGPPRSSVPSTPTHRELTLAALVARCGLPRSTTHRTADRMIRLGWLDKPQDRYRIGNRLFEIVRPGADPARAARGRAAVPAGPVPGHADHRPARRARRRPDPGRREDHRAPADADAVAGRRRHPGALLGAGPGDPRLLRAGGHRRCPGGPARRPYPADAHQSGGDHARS